MLTEDVESKLCELAFGDAKASDSVSACKILFAKGKYLDRIAERLESIVMIDSNTADSVRIKAIELLDKVRDELLEAQASVSASDEAQIRKQLIGRYVGNEEEITGST